MADNFDVVVVGSGPGGYVTAIRAAQLGMSTAIVERAELGGVCLNWGCIPTKALLKSGEVYEQLDHLADYGLQVEKRGYDFGKVIERSRKVAAQLNAGVGFLMKKHKIEVVEGAARLEKGAEAPKVAVALKAGGSRTLTAKHVILATGARARTFPDLGLEPDGERVWTYREALVPKAAPKSLIVIGSGAIGIEFASFYRALGAEVTVLEMLPRILPVEDEEVSKAARTAFQKRGVKFRVPANVKRLTKGKAGVSVEIEAGGKAETLEAEVAIVAVGIVGNVEDLGLEALGVKVERTHIVTDEHGATGVAGLYAIGDVAGPPWLAHKASHEGVHCVEHIAGLAPVHLPQPIPGCTYSTPQIASVGLTEAQAKEKYGEVTTLNYDLAGNGRSQILKTAGAVKLVAVPDGPVVGIHMVGSRVGELIAEAQLIYNWEAEADDVASLIHPHPTQSEALGEAHLALAGKPLHVHG